jgi:ubiquinone/menaquinone biosynthesis C-methylase UbiE
VKQNIYDNPDFFKRYKALRDTGAGLNETLEQPAMLSLLPDVTGFAVLDLGCGAGDLCRKIRELGASSVIGVDISSNMLELAQRDVPPGVQFVHQPIEDLVFDIGSFDLLISSLTFHYIADLDDLFAKAHDWLKPTGTFLFSTEHPIATCAQGIYPGWVKDKDGNKLYWPVDFYSEEGKRESYWLVNGVVKYHRMLSTILNSLIKAGFNIRCISEPVASAEEEERRPSLKEERRRPPFLIVSAARP